MAIENFDLEAQLEEMLGEEGEQEEADEALPETKNYAKNVEIALRALKATLDDVDQSRTMRRPLETVWVECYQLYLNEPEGQKYMGRANLAVPEAYRSVEILVSRLIQTLFSSDRWFRALPREEADKAQSEAVEALLRWETSRKNVPNEYVDFIKQSAIYGTSFAKVYWDFRKKRRIKKVKLPGGSTRREYRDDTVNQGPTFKMVNIEDIYVPTKNVSTIGELPFIIERSTVSEADLNAMSDAGIYENVGKVEPLRTNTGYDNDSLMRQARANSYGVDVDEEAYDSVNRYEILERWGEFDLKDDGHMVECVIVVANGRTVLRVEENPFDHQERPYVFNRYTPIPGELYGIGVIQPIRSLCYEVNDTRNQLMDHKTFALNPMFIVGAGAGVDETTFTARRGGLWSVNNVNQIKPVEIPEGAAMVAMQTEGILRASIEDATGATSLMGGGDPGRIEKATVFTGLIEEGNVRLRRVVEGITAEAIVPMLQMFWALEQQYRDEEISARALGKKGGNFQLHPIRPDEIIGDYDFMPVGALQMGAAFMRNQGLQNALQVMAPLAQQGLISPEEIKKMAMKLWDDGFGFYDAEDIFSETSYAAYMTPDQENREMLNGEAVKVHPRENHAEHVDGHTPAMYHAEMMSQSDPENASVHQKVAQNVRQHIQAHMQYADTSSQGGASGPQQPPGNVLAPPSPPGSAMAGGQGNPMMKEAAEMPMRQPG